MDPITPLPENPNRLAKNNKTKKRINKKPKAPFPTDSNRDPVGENGKKELIKVKIHNRNARIIR